MRWKLRPEQRTGARSHRRFLAVFLALAPLVALPYLEANALPVVSLAPHQGAPVTPNPDPSGQAIIPDPDQFQANAPTDDLELEADVRKLARQLRCPTCQALSIADSPSELAREMEGVIRQRLQAGMTPEQVRESFVAAYGEWVLLSPNPAGFNLLIYILPIAALLLGVAIVVVGMRRWLRNSVGEESASSAP